jgi:hypothetical protein
MCSSASATIPTDYNYYFDFEEGAGITANNANTSNPDLTMVDPDWSSFQGAVYFNASLGGGHTYAYLADNATNSISGTDSFTIVSKNNANGTTGSVMLQKTNSYQLRLASNYPTFYYYDDETVTSTKLQSTNTVNSSYNHTYVVLGNGTYIHLYVDGVLKDRDVYPTNGLEDTTGNTYMAGTVVTPTQLALYDFWMYPYAVDNISVFYNAEEEPIPYEPDGYARFRNDDSSNGYAPTVYLAGNLNLSEIYNYTVEYSNSSQSVNMSPYMEFNDNNVTLKMYSFIIQNNAYSLDLSGYDYIILEWNPNSTQIAAGATEFSFNGGYYNWSNLDILSGNSRRWKLAGVDYQGTSTPIIDSNFYDVLGFRLYDAPNTFIVENITFHDSVSGLSVSKAIDVTGGHISNVSIYNHSGTHLLITNFTDFYIDDFVAHTYNDESTGNDNFIVQGTASGQLLANTGGHDIVTNNISLLDATSRSAYCLKTLVYNVTGTNITAYNSGHNNLDLHACWNVTLTDVHSVGATASDNIQITSAATGLVDTPYMVHNYTGYTNERTAHTVTHDIIIRDYISINPVGSGIYANIMINGLFENLSFIGGQKALMFYVTENITVINSTTSNITAYSVTLGTTDTVTFKGQGWTNNTKLVDCEHGVDGVPTEMYYAYNTSLINYNETSFVFGAGYAEWESYQYFNARVINITGYPVANAILTANLTARNGYGDIQSTFYTDGSGYIDTDNRTNRMAILDYYRNNSGTTQYDVNVTATKDGQTDSQIVTMDGTYSANTSTGGLSGTLYTFTLDVTGEGEAIPLEIQSFTPTDTTPSSTNGTEQTFTVNFSKTVNSAGWYIDGILVEWDNSTAFASYSNSTAQVGTYNVTVIATDGVTEVNQTWIWTVSEDHDNEYVAVVFAGLSFVGLYFANRFRRR